MEKKILGILGGMGPEASEVFYHKIINATHASKDQDHLDILLWSHASIPDRTAMIKAGKTEALWQVFEKDIQCMKAFGIDYLAVPCNTSHYFADRMDEAMEHHFININLIEVFALRQLYIFTSGANIFNFLSFLF